MYVPIFALAMILLWARYSTKDSLREVCFTVLPMPKNLIMASAASVSSLGDIFAGSLCPRPWRYVPVRDLKT
jgi:hypothetical protein